MNLFRKRPKEQNGLALPHGPDGTNGPAPLSTDRQLVMYTASAEDQNPKSTIHNPISDLVFADEADVRALAEQPEQIDVETLADRLTDRAARPKRGLVFWAWIAAAPVFALWLTGSLLNGDMTWVPLCLFALATARVLGVQSARQEEDRTALRNAHLDNRWLGPLCEALEWPERVRSIAARLLAQRLPRVREGDAPLLGEEHRTCLYRRLTLAGCLSDPELVVAILQSLPFLGTEAALPYVERLTNLDALLPKLRRVRNAANATLAGLERRIAFNRSLTPAADSGAKVVGLRGALDLSSAGEEPLSEAEREELAAAHAHVDRQMAEFEAGMRKMQVPGMRYGFLIASWCIIFPYFAVQTVLQLHDGNWLLSLLSAVMALTSTQLYRLTLTAEHQRLARKLSKVEDVRCIGRLAEALEWPDAGVRNVAIDALTRLLRRVKATDKVLTTPRQRGNLHRMLALPNARRHEALLTSILQALAQIGDASSVPFVQSLANAQPTSAQQRRVCDAARDCLDYLKVRAELNRSSQTLLRASSASAAPADMLVRPADIRTATDPAQLLRPGAGNPSG